MGNLKHLLLATLHDSAARVSFSGWSTLSCARSCALDFRTGEATRIKRKNGKENKKVEREKKKRTEGSKQLHEEPSTARTLFSSLFSLCGRRVSTLVNTSLFSDLGPSSNTTTTLNCLVRNEHSRMKITKGWRTKRKQLIEDEGEWEKRSKIRNGERTI